MQNSSDRIDSISSVGDYPTVRFGAGPVKGHCPEVSTGPKIDQQESRTLSYRPHRLSRIDGHQQCKGPATTIVVIAAMPRLR